MAVGCTTAIKMGVCQVTSWKLCFLSSYYGSSLYLCDQQYIKYGAGQLAYIFQHLCGNVMAHTLLQFVLGWFQFNAAYPTVSWKI
jgi:hypothetical protein